MTLLDSSMVLGVTALRFEGKTLDAEVANALEEASIDFGIDGASTLSLTLRDTHRTLLRSGMLSQSITAQIDGNSFQLAQVRKSGHDLECVFEDLAVAALRTHDSPLIVAAGTTTRLDFAKRLVGEEPWVQFVGPYPWKLEVTKAEIGRGKIGTLDGTQKPETEDSWTALGRIADEVQWRRFVRNNKEVWFVPDQFLMARTPEYTAREFSEGVDHIDFDYDTGKPVATATVNARSGKWSVLVGSVVTLSGCGPADGNWLVTKISRSLFTVGITITLEQPRPELPEPVQEAPESGSPEMKEEGVGVDQGGVSGGHVNTGAVSDKGWSWPVNGPITSGFGPRGKPHSVGFGISIGSTNHEGIDIGVSDGTPVGAAKDGVVIKAGEASGYGLAVYIDHGGSVSRYGHLSKVQTKRGLEVGRGDQIGLSGHTGDATGPHLHFEIRPHDNPEDPLKYLPAPTRR